MSGGAALIGVSKYERSVGGYSGGGKRPAAARMPADPVRALAPTLNRNDRLESVIFISTGGGAPPPPRTDADTAPRLGRGGPGPRPGVAAAAFPLAAGPHPRRELTPPRSRGVPGPRLSVAAGAFPLAAGPRPRRELTPTPSRGVPGPRLTVAAG